MENKNILLKAQFHILMIFRTVYERVEILLDNLCKVFLKKTIFFSIIA